MLNFAPYLGPAVTLGVLSMVSLASFDGWLAILAPPLVFLLLTGLEGQIVTPLILGRSMTLNPVAVFLSLLLWGWMWGALGIILAVPLLAAVSMLASRSPSLRPVSAVLA